MTTAEESFPTNRFDAVSEYLNTRDQYFRNAEEFYSREEWKKTSELLWGAISQTIKALGALENKQIFEHKEFYLFMRQLSKELNEPNLYQEFIDLNALHKNFYDASIPNDALPIYFERSKKFIKRLDDLIEGIRSKSAGRV